MNSPCRWRRMRRRSMSLTSDNQMEKLDITLLVDDVEWNEGALKWNALKRFRNV